MKWKPLFLLLLGLLLGACHPKPLLEKVQVAPTAITPNADGKTDLARFSFQLNRGASLAISLSDAQGRQYTFRPAVRLAPNEEKPYQVYFGGVVDGYRNAGESFPYAIRKRMLPDGVYTWWLTAQSPEEQAVYSGTITLTDADIRLPGVSELTLSRRTFSPNQDGLADQVQVKFRLQKDVDALRVYLAGPDEVAYTLKEDRQQAPVALNAAGEHTFIYDINAQPPPNGSYPLMIETRDKMGQTVIASTTLTVVNAGLPHAYILDRRVHYSQKSLVLSDTLCFTLTVQNDSDTYLRTTGPWPGTTYRSDECYQALGWPEDKGVFRVGMDFDTSLQSYPFRWGLGHPGIELVQMDGHWYLPPQARSEITGCVQVVDIPVRDPLYYWAGLIHEGMSTPATNLHVDPRFITIWK